MAIFAIIDFSGLQYPSEVQVELKTCNTICGTHVQTILNHKDLTGSAGGCGKVKIWPKIAPICPILHRTLTFPDPFCRPGQILVVQNGLYMCPAYCITCFKFKQHLRRVF